MPKRQLPIQADLIINRLRWEAMVDRQLDAFDVDDDAPHVPSKDPLSLFTNLRARSWEKVAVLPYIMRQTTPNTRTASWFLCFCERPRDALQ